MLAMACELLARLDALSIAEPVVEKFCDTISDALAIVEPLMELFPANIIVESLKVDSLRGVVLPEPPESI